MGGLLADRWWPREMDGECFEWKLASIPHGLTCVRALHQRSNRRSKDREGLRGGEMK